MYQALMMSRSMYIEHINKPVELPKEVGKSSLGTCILLCKRRDVVWRFLFHRQAYRY
jgi:hypothetical protein